MRGGVEAPLEVAPLGQPCLEHVGAHGFGAPASPVEHTLAVARRAGPEGGVGGFELRFDDVGAPTVQRRVCGAQGAANEAPVPLAVGQLRDVNPGPTAPT